MKSIFKEVEKFFIFICRLISLIAFSKILEKVRCNFFNKAPSSLLFIAGLGFNSRPVHVGFLLQKVGIGHPFLQVLWFSSVIIPSVHHIHILLIKIKTTFLESSLIKTLLCLCPVFSVSILIYYA